MIDSVWGKEKVERRRIEGRVNEVRSKRGALRDESGIGKERVGD
jgi:hypothetical protein